MGMFKNRCRKAEQTSIMPSNATELQVLIRNIKHLAD